MHWSGILFLRNGPCTLQDLKPDVEKLEFNIAHLLNSPCLKQEPSIFWREPLPISLLGHDFSQLRRSRRNLPLCLRIPASLGPQLLDRISIMVKPFLLASLPTRLHFRPTRSPNLHRSNQRPSPTKPDDRLQRINLLVPGKEVQHIRNPDNIDLPAEFRQRRVVLIQDIGPQELALEPVPVPEEIVPNLPEPALDVRAVHPVARRPRRRQPPQGLAHEAADVEHRRPVFDPRKHRGERGRVLDLGAEEAPLPDAGVGERVPGTETLRELFQQRPRNVELDLNG